MIQVTGAIIIQNDRVLAARRALHKHMGGYWELPGGKIEEGETPEESLARELSEEMGIIVEVGEHFYSNQHDYGDKQIILMAYICFWAGGDLILNDHDAIEWCTSQDIANLNWAPADIPIVQALAASMKNSKVSSNRA